MRNSSSQTAGGPRPRSLDANGLESRYTFDPFSLEESPRRRSRGHRTGDSPQVSVDDVPPRTSSKQRAPTDSIGYPSIQRPGSRDVHKMSSPRARGSPERRSARPSKRPSILDLDARHFAASPSPTSKPQTEAQNPKLRSPDELHSQPTERTFPSARTALQNSINQAKGERTSSVERELVKDLDTFVQAGRENSPSPMDRKSMRDSRQQNRTTVSAASSREVRSPEQRNFYLSPNGDIEPYIAPQVPDPIDRGSIDKTPQQFYAPMRVPPSLIGSNVTARPPADTWRASKDVALPRTASPFRVITASGHRTGASEDTKTGTKPWKVNTLSSKRLQKFQSSTDRSPTDIGHSSLSKLGGLKQAKPKDPKAASSDNEGKAAGVRAMAAFFDQPEHAADASSARAKHPDRGPPNLASKTLPPFKTTPPSNQKPTAPWSLRNTAPNMSDTAKPTEAQQTPRLRNSVSASVALRTAALVEAEKQHQGPSTERLPLARLRQGIVTKKPVPESESAKDFQSQMKVGQSLGTMTPHQEQPPIAQHLNLARPSSAASLQSLGSSRNQSLESVLVPRSSTPLKRPSSTTSLHSQVRNLQRQLEAKTDEAAQLRRQVEAQEGTDVGTLSEQLREARREVQMWKERAEAAERRLKVFERFTARLKGIREAAAAADQRSVADGENDLFDPDDDDGACCSDGNVSPDNQRVRFMEGRRTKDFGSDDSGRTEDAGVVTARIRKCLHGGTHGPADTVDGTRDSPATGYDTASRNTGRIDTDVWMGFEEFLDRA